MSQGINISMSGIAMARCIATGQRTIPCGAIGR
jgi:hypothetical protein